MLTVLFVKFVHLLKTSGKRWLATQTGLLSTTLLVRVAEWSAGALLPLRKALAAIYFPPPPTPPPTPPAPPSTSMSPPAAADVPLPQHAAVAHTHSAPSQRRRVVRSLICSDPAEPETLAADGTPGNQSRCHDVTVSRQVPARSRPASLSRYYFHRHKSVTSNPTGMILIRLG